MAKGDPNTGQYGHRIHSSPDPSRTRPHQNDDIEEYKGHVLEVLIEVSPTDNVGNEVHKLLLKCYSQPATVPAPYTLRYTLKEFPSNLVWTQERTPADSLHLNAISGIEMSLSYEGKLEWITKKNYTILAFLPLPDLHRATPSQSNEEMSDMAQLPGQTCATESVVSNAIAQGETLPSTHQIFVKILDTGKKADKYSDDAYNYLSRLAQRRIEPPPIHPHTLLSDPIRGENPYESGHARDTGSHQGHSTIDDHRRLLWRR